MKCHYFKLFPSSKITPLCVLCFLSSIDCDWLCLFPHMQMILPLLSVFLSLSLSFFAYTFCMFRPSLYQPFSGSALCCNAWAKLENRAKWQTVKQQLSLTEQVRFGLFLARADVALMGREEQCLSGKNKLLRLTPKWCKSCICTQILNWEPRGKRTGMEIRFGVLLGFLPDDPTRQPSGLR